MAWTYVDAGVQIFYSSYRGAEVRVVLAVPERRLVHVSVWRGLKLSLAARCEMLVTLTALGRHALPPGYVFESEKKKNVDVDSTPIEELVEEQVRVQRCVMARG